MAWTQRQLESKTTWLDEIGKEEKGASQSDRCQRADYVIEANERARRVVFFWKHCQYQRTSKEDSLKIALERVEGFIGQRTQKKSGSFVDFVQRVLEKIVGQRGSVCNENATT